MFSRDGALSAHIYGTSLIIKKVNWVEEARKFSFGAMPSPSIPGLAVLTKTFPSPNAEQVLSSNRNPVRLYMDSYSTNIPVK